MLTVDNVMHDAGALVEYACREVWFAPAWNSSGGYPGLRAPAPLDYVNALVRALSPTIEQAFSLHGVKLVRAECNLLLVTLPPEQLVASQRIQHYDTVDPLQFALLHFLCGAEFGGTAFYRHRATGSETLSREREPVYERCRAEEQAGCRPGPTTSWETPSTTDGQPR